MSTVIGLVKEEQQIVDVTQHLEAVGAGLDKIKVLTDSEEAQNLLYKKNYAECHLFDCMVMGALAGIAVFLPLGLLITIFSCSWLGGCSPLAWGPGLLALTVTGAVVGAGMASFIGTHRLEQNEQVYVESIGGGSKLVVVPAESKESAARAATILEQDHASAIKIINEG